MRDFGFILLGAGIEASIVAILLKVGWLEIKSPEQQALAATVWFIFSSVVLLVGRPRRR